ncbi:MAG: hypothetical protein LBP64_05395 [Tannerella sp.]|nr:hypothetical protein [Tannerella sp.]
MKKSPACFFIRTPEKCGLTVAFVPGVVVHGAITEGVLSGVRRASACI